MICKKCGKELSDSSKFCTACGTKTEQDINDVIQENNQIAENQSSKTVKVVITRLKKMVGCAIPMKIIIDGNKVTSLKNNSTFEIDLPIGEHKLLIDTVGEVTDRVLNLTPDLNKVQINLVMKFGLVSGKAAIESIKTE